MLVRTEAFRRKAAVAAYAPNAVVADGINDNLTRSDLVGAADAKQWTTAFAVKFNALDKFQYIYMGRAGLNIRYSIALDNNNKILFFARDSSGTDILDVESSITLTTGAWYSIAASVDLTDPTRVHLFINDVDRLGTVTTFTDALADFTPGENNVAASPSGASPFNLLDGEVSEIWGDFGRYVDFSVEANRRLFFNASNCLVDKGSDGSTPFGTPPILFLRDPAATFNVNSGSGGDYTLFGSFTDSVDPPCGA